MREATGQGNVQSNRLLEGALLFTLIAHAAAMASMLVLLPGMPGGATLDVADRARFVADHPWLWRVGWLPWQITSVSDLVLAVALAKTKWIAKGPAAATVVVTLAAMVPDLTGQMLWVWMGPGVAARAVSGGDIAAYRVFEDRVFHLIAGWATVGYIAAALGWTWCFAAAGVWSKRLTWLSWVVWPLFIVSTALLAAPVAGSSVIVSVGNAAGFVLLMIWLGAVTERVLRRSRHDADHGRWARWRHPSRGVFYRCLDGVAQSRLARALAGMAPALAMDSDITNVIYVNYLVEAERLEKFVVEPLKLQRLGPDGRYALFTFLTFRHGHFGPRCLGPFRRLWPSPIQSNWRIHVYDPRSGKRGIQFLTIAITTTPIAIAARLLAENVPMHVAKDGELSLRADGSIALRMEPGEGTAPDLEGSFAAAEEPVLTEPWDRCFGAWRDMLAYCVPQDRAMSAEPWRRRICRQEITLNIPLESCRPMNGSVVSNAAAAIAGDAKPLCFLVEKVEFRLLREEYDGYSI